MTASPTSPLPTAIPPGGVFVLLGKGDGSFDTAVRYGTGQGFGSVASADFNGDGRLDLALTGGGLSVLLGKGDGTFQTAVKYGPEGSLVLGDFNGDGKPDLAVTTISTGGVVILLNTCASAGIHLGIVRSNSALTLSWPLPPTGFFLESTAGLGSTNWQPVAEVPRTNNDHLELIAPLDQPGRFFRLRKL